MMSLFAALSLGFSAPGRFAQVGQQRGCLSMNAVKVTSNFEVTDSIKDYANQKLSKPIDTFGALLNEDLQLHLKVESRALHDTEHKGKESHIAEVTAFCVDKHVINAKADGEDMYASIDELTDTLTRSLRKYKEKRIDLKEGRKRARKGDMEGEIMQDEE